MRLYLTIFIGLFLGFLNFRAALLINSYAIKKDPGRAQAIVVFSMLIRLSTAILVIFIMSYYFMFSLVALLLSFVIAYTVFLIAEVKVLLNQSS